VKVCLENMFTEYRHKIVEAVCTDPHQACAYIDTLNEAAGFEAFAFCLDTGHLTLLGRDHRAVINTLGHRLQTLHIHDNDGVRDWHAMPCTGATDWDAFVAGLKDVGYSGTICFESGGSIQAFEAFDPALIPHVLKLIAETGKLFCQRLL